MEGSERMNDFLLVECSPLKVAEQGAHQLSDAALVGWHHPLQAHHQVSAVLGVEHHQLVLPGGHAHPRDLRQRRRSLTTNKHGLQRNKGIRKTFL